MIIINGKLYREVLSEMYVAREDEIIHTLIGNKMVNRKRQFFEFFIN